MTASLPGRLKAHWRASGFPGGGAPVIVAFSGGLDSLVLLHLLRFSLPDVGVILRCAHFDHRVRAGSGADAEWARGVAGAWGVPFHLGRAPEPPHDAAAARHLRYRFLEELLAENDAARVLTAHHADDQAETVLFRVLRGTGLEGLRGIPAFREPGIVRPLLPFSRAELEAYAEQHGIRPRTDPSNRSLRYARNRVRRRVLPILAEVHPGAREGLRRLARNAARSSTALQTLLEPVIRSATLERKTTEVVLDRNALVSLPDAVRVEAVRALATSLGSSLSESGTADAVAFITTVRSGARLDLPGRLRVSRDFDRIVFERARGSGEVAPGFHSTRQEAVIASAAAGEGGVVIAEKQVRVRWGSGPPPSAADVEAGWRWIDLEPAELAFPLSVRGWRPGDRTRTEAGTRKLKKLFGDLRVPREERHRLPLLADAQGCILWIPGLHRAAGLSGRGEGSWFVGVDDADAR